MAAIYFGKINYLMAMLWLLAIVLFSSNDVCVEAFVVTNHRHAVNRNRASAHRNRPSRQLYAAKLEAKDKPFWTENYDIFQDAKKNNHETFELIGIYEASEESSSRRAFLQAMVSTGLIVAVGTESANAAETASKKSEFPTTVTSAAATAGNIDSGSAVAAVDWNAILKKASKKALGGGKAGATAAVVQVCSLMWLRTSMNYQYRYGGNLQSSLATLWEQGGVSRLYQGLPFALIQGPLTRFGDTAANVGILALLDTLPATQDLPLPLKTACGSFAAGLWRIVLMPVDASKTAMQVEGSTALSELWRSVGENGPGVLYRGALAQAAATAVGHFPWFLTYNFLDAQLPVINAQDDLLLSLCRSAVLGLSASCVSDCASNSLRVIKTTKQTASLNRKENEINSSIEAEKKGELSYAEVVKMIIETDGILGLFGRGLQTRLLTNAIQGAAFSVLWRYFQQVNGV